MRLPVDTPLPLSLFEILISLFFSFFPFCSPETQRKELSGSRRNPVTKNKKREVIWQEKKHAMSSISIVWFTLRGLNVCKCKASHYSPRNSSISVRIRIKQSRCQYLSQKLVRSDYGQFKVKVGLTGSNKSQRLCGGPGSLPGPRIGAHSKRHIGEGDGQVDWQLCVQSGVRD